MRLVYLWRKFSCKAHLQIQPQWKGCAPALPFQRGSSSLATTSPTVFNEDEASRHKEGTFWCCDLSFMNETLFFSCLNPIYFKTSHSVLDHYNLFKKSDSLKAWSSEVKEQAPHTSPPAMLCMAWPPAPSSPTSQSIPDPGVQPSCDASQEKEMRKKRSFSVQWRKLQNIAKMCTLISSC